MVSPDWTVYITYTSNQFCNFIIVYQDMIVKLNAELFHENTGREIIPEKRRIISLPVLSPGIVFQ